MKKQIIILFSIVMAMVIGFAGCGGDSGDNSQAPPSQTGSTSDPGSGSGAQNDGPAREIKFAYVQPEASFYGDTYGYFGKCIEEETGGTLKVEMYPSETLASQVEIYDAIAMGNIDMGHVYSTFISPTISDLIPFEVPGIYPADNYEILNNYTFEIVDSIFQDYNTKWVALSYPDTCSFSTKPRMVRSPEDLKGLSIRTAGKYVSEAMARWGGNPATIPIGDVMTSLERGTIDSTFQSWMMADSYKFYEVGKNETFTSMQNAYYGVVMNLDVWNSLTTAEQEGIMRAADRFREFSQVRYESVFDAFIESIHSIGGDYVVLTPEENDVFISESLKLMDEVEGLLSPKGLALAEALANMREELT